MQPAERLAGAVREAGESPQPRSGARALHRQLRAETLRSHEICDSLAEFWSAFAFRGPDLPLRLRFHCESVRFFSDLKGQAQRRASSPLSCSQNCSRRSQVPRALCSEVLNTCLDLFSIVCLHLFTIKNIIYRFWLACFSEISVGPFLFPDGHFLACTFSVFLRGPWLWLCCVKVSVSLRLGLTHTHTPSQKLLPSFRWSQAVRILFKDNDIE